MKQMKVKLSKDQIKKLLLSGMGFVVLIYVYFSFFLGPLNDSRDATLKQINELQDKVTNSKSELTKTAKRTEDELQERFSRHMASHGAALCSFGV